MTLTPDQSAALLLEYVRGHLPLTDLAVSAGLTLVELLNWAESPEIARTLDALEALAHRHTRLAAAIAAAPAVKLLDQLVDSTAQEDRNPPDEDPKTTAHRRLSRELARKCATTIVSIAKPPRPPRPKKPKRNAPTAAGDADTTDPLDLQSDPPSNSDPDQAAASWADPYLAAHAPFPHPRADPYPLVRTAGALAAAAGEPTGRPM